MPSRAEGGRQLRVDRVACTGHGVCASILPRRIQLDEWGYPVIDDPEVDAGSSDVRAVVRLCPAGALYLGS